MLNEIIQLFYNVVMRKLMKRMVENEHYCFCVDEAVDTTNSELLFIVFRQATKGFSVEDFFRILKTREHKNRSCS